MSDRDPTYDMAKINACPVWRAAFIMSEWLNNNAPLGWSRYIPVAEAVLLAERPPTVFLKPNAQKLAKPVKMAKPVKKLTYLRPRIKPSRKK